VTSSGSREDRAQSGSRVLGADAVGGDRFLAARENCIVETRRGQRSFRLSIERPRHEIVTN
jgi:hypothetical protein